MPFFLISSVVKDTVRQKRVSFGATKKMTLAKVQQSYSSDGCAIVSNDILDGFWSIDPVSKADSKMG